MSLPLICYYNEGEKNFQDDFPSIAIDKFRHNYLLVFNLTSKQDATENRHYSKVVGERLRLEPKSTFALEHTSEIIVLGERIFLAAVYKFGVVEKIG